MRKGTKDEIRTTKILLALYLFFLTWIILFKTELNIGEMIDTMHFRSVNLIPLGGSAMINGRPDLSEIVLNIIAFIPFGVYTSMLAPESGFLKKLLPVFSASFLYEALQYILAIGASDITDLTGNTLGGIIGIGVFCLIRRLLKDKAVRAVNIAAGIGTVLGVLLLGALIYLNL